MPKPTWSTVIGIAKEATAGTPLAPTAFIPLTKADFKDDLKYLEDKGWRGAPVEVYDHILGSGTSDISIDGNVYADTLPFIIAGILGDVTTTGSSTPYTHAMALNNTATPKTYTLTDYVQGSIRQYAGCVFTETQLKITPNALFTHSTKATGLLSAVTTKPTASFSQVPTAAGWSVAPKIGGAAITTLLDAEVDIKRPADPVLAVGSSTPYSIYPGFLDVSGKLDFVMEDETQLTTYLTGATTAIDLNLTLGSGATGTQVLLHMSQCAYTAAVKERGKSYITCQVNFSAEGETTDQGSTAGYSPIKVTFQNALAANTF